jgi:hypothetical protein
MMNIRQQGRNFHHITGSQHLKQITFPFSTETYEPGDAGEYDVYGVRCLTLLVYDRTFGKLANRHSRAQRFQFA